jgi:uncharacterized protein YndB with AHSA1/START domain
MTGEPDVPLRVEMVFELPGTAEQVWQAIATGPGISSWFVPTDLDERLGGSIVAHMGETDSPGRVTGWEPNRRLAYEEPEWAALAGHEGEPVTPLATEFLIEAQSGGTCVLRVVTSAFGTGADWEQEFIDEMEQGWRPYFDRLRLYLAHFPGQHATVLEASRSITGRAYDAVLAAMCESLGVDRVDGGAGQAVEARGVKGQVERIDEYDLLVRVTDPVPGFLGIGAWGLGQDEAKPTVMAMVQGHFFSDDAPGFVERERPRWQEWLEAL